MSTPRHYDFLGIDIVGYSQLDGEDQVVAISRLMDVVRNSSTIQATRDQQDRVFLPTGDGMFIGFLGLPTRPLELSVEIHRAYGNDRSRLKMGIHSGLAFQIEDINGAHNVAGSGINMAARVLSCCRGGHILVASQPGDTLKNDFAAWRNPLIGPYEFVVKHGKSLIAYNLTDGVSYGNPSETFSNLFFKGSYSRLKTRLAARGLSPSRELMAFASSGSETLALGDVLLDVPIAGFAGLPSSKIVVHTQSGTLQLPEVVHEAKAALPPAPLNRPKAFVTRVTPPISDRDGVLHLDVVHSDFSTSRAIEQSIRFLHSSLLQGEYDLSTFPRRLDCPIVVISGDQQLVLCKRAPADVVRYFPLTWEVSVGESMDVEYDSTGDCLDPDKTVRRGLVEELALPPHVVDIADVKFIAIATEWPILAANLIAVARLADITADQLRDWFPGAADREHTHIDMIDVSVPEPGIKLFMEGWHSCTPKAATTAKLNDISRVALLSTLFHIFGYHTILSKLE